MLSGIYIILHNWVFNKTMGISYCNSYCDLHPHLHIRAHSPSSNCRRTLILTVHNCSGEIALGLRELPHLRFLLPSRMATSKEHSYCLCCKCTFFPSVLGKWFISSPHSSGTDWQQGTYPVSCVTSYILQMALDCVDFLQNMTLVHSVVIMQTVQSETNKWQLHWWPW